MKIAFTLFILLSFQLLIHSQITPLPSHLINNNHLILAPSTMDAAVMLEAAVDPNNNVIHLSWQKSTNATSYQLFRKNRNASSWGTPKATLSGIDTSFMDTTVTQDHLYEYRIVKNAPDHTGYGYITSGINLTAIEDRGSAIVVVDSSLADSLTEELFTFTHDLIADGYQQVSNIFVSRNEKVDEVKSKIKKEYILLNNPTNNPTSLILIGHIPVPYSGNINPDGHPDHQGAWPTDLYYADMDGIWTDVNENSLSTNPARIVNKPGDLKWDQSIIPSNIELQVGRIDFYNMPAFADSELALLRKYFIKNHNYRTGNFHLENKAVIDDNFGYFGGEAFAASGYNNFSTLVSRNKIIQDDYFTNLNNQETSFKWSYGCGGGSFTSASGIGNTSDFAKANCNGAFTLLFGSYFGDWDVTNSFLRAPLAQGKTLTCFWSGRPHHQYHGMAMGETIGYGFKTSVNNSGLYYPNVYGITGRWIHNSLMGDPTLRNDVVDVIKNFTTSYHYPNLKLKWEVQSNIDSYCIYQLKENKEFIKIAEVEGGLDSLDISCPTDTGNVVYMIKAMKLEVTPSGSYFNLSSGSFDTVEIETVPLVQPQIISNVFEDNFFADLQNPQNEMSYNWFINDKFYGSTYSIHYKFDTTGTYQIKLVYSNACLSDSISTSINYIYNKTTDLKSEDLRIYPNPAITAIQFDDEIEKIVITDLNSKEILNSYYTKQIDISALPAGMYLVTIFNKGQKIKKGKLVKL